MCACVRSAMAGWLHGVCVGACLFVSPLCGFSLSVFCHYSLHMHTKSILEANDMHMPTCSTRPRSAPSYSAYPYSTTLTTCPDYRCKECRTIPVPSAPNHQLQAGTDRCPPRGLPCDTSPGQSARAINSDCDLRQLKLVLTLSIHDA